MLDDLDREVLWGLWLASDGLGEDSLDGLWGLELSLLGGADVGDFLEGVLPLLAGTNGEALAAAALRNGDGLEGWAEDVLNFIGLDDGIDVLVVHDGAWDDEALLGLVDGVESLEGGLGPDGEAAWGAGWGELGESKSADWEDVNTWDVAEGLSNAGVLVVDNEWALAGLVSRAAELALGGAVDLAVDDALNIAINANLLEEFDSIMGALDLLSSISDNDRNFLDLTKDVAAGLDEWDDGGGSDGRSDSIAALLEWDWAEPAAHEGWWGKAVTTTAEVSVSTLAIAVGT